MLLIGNEFGLYYVCGNDVEMLSTTHLRIIFEELSVFLSSSSSFFGVKFVCLSTSQILNYVVY